jgi:hypothetical protein
MPLGWFGAGARNRERVRQENQQYKILKEQWENLEKERKAKYDFDKENYENQLKQAEERARFEEKGLIENYEYGQKMQDFEYDTATRAYDKSVERAGTQKRFNELAYEAAWTQQNNKIKDDFLGILFDENQTFLDYKANSTGLQMKKQNALVAADFKEAGNKAKYQFDKGSFSIERNRKRSESRIDAQKAILEGMKAAGTIRAKGTAGRSSAKSALGVLAESGAMQANIANALMYAEQSIDLGVSQLHDMFILDQAMVTAARDQAKADAEFGQTKLDAKNEQDKAKIDASRKSAIKRDAVVKQNILNARIQADLNAEAAILLKPERLPSSPDPRELYKEYDNPETEDYIELFYRPEVVEFPEYIPSRKPERDDVRGPREDVALSNVMDVLSIGGMVAGGIGAIGPGLGLFSGTTANYTGTLFGMSGQAWQGIGSTLGGLGRYAR